MAWTYFDHKTLCGDTVCLLIEEEKQAYFATNTTVAWAVGNWTPPATTQLIGSYQRHFYFF